MTGPRRPVRRLRAVPTPILRLADAVDEFLAHPDPANSSLRSWPQTLGGLQHALGVERPVDRLGARELERVAREAWGQTAPATWNRHIATLRSFSGSCVRRGWIDAPIAAELERRREHVDRTKPIPNAQLDGLWRRDDVAAREKALWRLLYETDDRAHEVLSLNAEDGDLENKRAGVRSKAGDNGWLHLNPLRAAAAPADRRPAERSASNANRTK
jgi:integrase